jgi:hypothetical protein
VVGVLAGHFVVKIAFLFFKENIFELNYYEPENKDQYKNREDIYQHKQKEMFERAPRINTLFPELMRKISSQGCRGQNC